jgi:metal-sulfur cluster biosynthetic enzyme
MEDARTQHAIEKGLSKIRDPKTGLDVLRMGLIRDLDVSDGQVSLVFRPSARIGSHASQLGSRIHDAIRSVNGVQRVVMRIEPLNPTAEGETLPVEGV